MITLQQNKKILILFGLLTSILFTIVMFVVNPLIDGKTGLEVIKLQIAFQTETGRIIINNWQEIGKENFLKYIFTDYLYAISYSIFLASIYMNKLLKKNIQLSKKHLFIFILPFIAGIFDMIENTIEILFIKNPVNFSEIIFGLHSVFATLKWIALPIIAYYLIKPIKEK